MEPALLGTPGDWVVPTDPADAYDTKAGGPPIWPAGAQPPPKGLTSCPRCGGATSLVLQVRPCSSAEAQHCRGSRSSLAHCRRTLLSERPSSVQRAALTFRNGISISSHALHQAVATSRTRGEQFARKELAR